jgi:ribulose 1,5-bisphosphate carboxylase large subunit-like protein
VSQSVYVYYRSSAGARAVREAVGAMQAALARATGVSGRLVRRVEGDGTWMEIYEDLADPARFESELAAAVASFGLEALLAPGATRHIERFTGD